ncbi:glutathione S-transferase omega-1 [Amyelois transitella]|uniref:glutathione S-transferase omega-1 n=1 Tax=Amyelois transitella TaxID=680683 RepID=UPI00298FBE2D|nr:glutathione S-transferase omega-1 [Amyelois transitella]
MTKKNFNTKHLRKGDLLPPFTGKLRVYSMRFCPYAQRTLLALIAKDIDYEVVNIHLMDKPEWYPTKSQFGKVPALEIADGLTIYESLVTVEYLDDVYPQRPLLPKDPVTKAYDKIIIESTGPIQSILMMLVRTPDAITEDHIAAYKKALEFIEEQLKKRSKKFLGGTQPGFVDYMIWPWFERTQYGGIEDDRVKIDRQKHKVLSEYIGNMYKDPAVQQYLVPENVYKKVYEAYKNPTIANLDILIN